MWCCPNMPAHLYVAFDSFYASSAVQRSNISQQAVQQQRVMYVCPVHAADAADGGMMMLLMVVACTACC